jgi:hypothetical protein
VSLLGGVLWGESSRGVLGSVYCIGIRRGKLSPIFKKRLWGQFWGLDSPEDPPEIPWGESLGESLGGVLWGESSRGVLRIKYCIVYRNKKGGTIANFQKKALGQFWGLDSPEDPPEDPLGRVLWAFLWGESSGGSPLGESSELSTVSK